MVCVSFVCMCLIRLFFFCCICVYLCLICMSVCWCVILLVSGSG